MRIARKLQLRLKSLFRGARAERELEEEIRNHFEFEVAQHLAAGRTLDEARAAARRAFGGAEQVKEACRDTRRVAFLSHAVQDLRYGVRMLRKHPGFAATTILTVALGIAATTAIFSIVYGVVLRPLPFGEPGRLAGIYCANLKSGFTRMSVSGALHRDWRDRQHAFEEIAITRNVANFNITGAQEPERVLGARVSSNLFRVLGVQPLLGRTFRDGEDRISLDDAGRAPIDIVILSHGLWQRRFGGDPNVLGAKLLLSGQPHTIVGVMGPDFQYPSREFALWVPLTIHPEELRLRIGYSFLAVGRLKPGVTFDQAQADMRTVRANLAREFPGSYRDIDVMVEPLIDSTVAAPIRTALYVLLGAVGCLLLIGCANLANLLFARALVRGRELTVRAALGAGRGRLLLQSLTELLPILCLGGTLGVAAALWMVNLLVRFLPAQMPRVESIGVNGPVLAFSGGTLLVTGLLAGLLPALQASRADLATSMKDDARGASAGRERARLRSLLVIAQVAAAILLLIGASLLVRSFVRLASVDPGFKPDNAISLLMAVPRAKYDTDPKIAAYTHRLVDRVKALPGVEAAGTVNRLPLGSGAIQTGGLQLEGSVLPDEIIPSTDWRNTTPDYFRAVGIPLIAGRFYSDSDTDTSPRVGLIDERLARLAYPNGSPIGKRFRIPLAGEPWGTIIGVVGHIRHDGLDVDPRPQVYWPQTQRTQDRLALVVRTKQDPAAMTTAIVAAIREVDGDQAVYDVQTMTEVVAQSLSHRWLNMMLLTLFAGVSLLLATIGIYGVIAYTASQRQREFGVRIALGAERRDIVRLVVGQGARLAAIGGIIGVAAALLVARVLEGLLYEIGTRDALSFAGATTLLLAIAIVASYVPARRASRSDPIQALRGDP
jgi:putative ABC transport system permease protein